jgi:alpha-1,2-mannosyltransferase
VVELNSRNFETKKEKKMILLVVICIVLAIVATPPLLALHFDCARRRRDDEVAIMHPNCNDCAGGERVLWLLVAALQSRWPRRRVLIYHDTSASVSPNDIVQKACARFGVDLDSQAIEFRQLYFGALLRASSWRRLTMLGQSVGSALVAICALVVHKNSGGKRAWRGSVPSVFVDTTGFAFMYPVWRHVASARVATYTHYPTVSSDMLQRVEERAEAHNNRGAIASSAWLSAAKLRYYRLFAAAYGWAGRRATLALVNSTWTRAHIDDVWRVPERTHVVFPPCNTAALQQLPLERQRDGDSHRFLSIGQFRPEKEHDKQVRALALLVERLRPLGQSAHLVLLGSCRDDADQSRCDALRALAAELGVTEHVTFAVNVPFDELKAQLAAASFGVHTMWCEHFGIGVVEFQAAGVIPIAHNSGGPKCDIVAPGVTGFLAASVDEYADAMLEATQLSAGDRVLMQRAAREHAKSFSDQVFADRIHRLFEIVF